jgi:CxxC motif-containing protein (DUF1111 family)
MTLKNLVIGLLALQLVEAAPQINHFTNAKDKKAFSHPMTGLNDDELDTFIVGKSFFRIPWVEAPSATTARDGLGPLFNANTCMHCHPNNGAGVAINAKGAMNRSYLLRLSHKNPSDQTLLKTIGFEPDSTYGSQLSLNGSHTVPAEAKVSVHYEEIKGTYPDGTKYSLRKPHYSITDKNYRAFDKDTIFAARIGSALVGLGLLEQIDEKDIVAQQDINDSNGDGISGRANYAFDPETNTTKLGRFTWKASATTVKHQSGAAAHNDMGLSNPLFPTHNCTPKQKECIQESSKGRHVFDLPQKRLDAIAFYLSNLAVPKQRNPKKHQAGAKLFESINCSACHTPTQKTRDGVVFHPYSDLLLHDMGEGLADGRSEFLANGNEWRTSPLWGKGLYAKVSGEANYLHDGRARSIEEAILWHGGEAKGSKEKFMKLDKKSRQKLINFLESL